MIEDELLVYGFQIICQIGKGANATTYRTKMLKTNQEAALKLISLRQVKDWKIIELFEREAKVLASLNHSQIPKYIEYLTIDTEIDRYFCIVQELAIGETLEVLFQKGWQPDENEVRDIALQLMRILAYLHNLNPPVIHRDIKPANIIYQPDYKKIFLVDFGAVQDVYRNSFSHGLTFVGTMGFIAPEQYTGQVSFASDLYSLGATIVYLLTGVNPADIPQKRLRLEWKRVLMQPISEEFGNWIDTLLSPIPEERSSSSLDSLAVLEGKKKSIFSLKSDPPILPFVNCNVLRNRENLVIICQLKDIPLIKSTTTLSFFPTWGLFLVFSSFFVGSFFGGTIVLVIPIIEMFSFLLPFLMPYMTWIALAYMRFLWLARRPYLKVVLNHNNFDLEYRGRRKIKFNLDSQEITEVVCKCQDNPNSLISLTFEKNNFLMIYHGVKEFYIAEDNVFSLDFLKWLSSEINDFLQIDYDL